MMIRNVQEQNQFEPISNICGFVLSNKYIFLKNGIFKINVCNRKNTRI
jgi:hypothetical protein